ncbi:MAG: winged helix-turn-helix transcriptional regulator [Rikenellaceae bacterium]
MAKAHIDATDRKILSLLIENARMPFLEIARECGISGAAIHQRVKKLEDSGVIIGSRLVVDPRMLGFDVCAIIGIGFTDPKLNLETVEILRQIPEAVEAHFITGHFNMLVKIYCRDNNHLMSILFEKILKIPGIAQTETFISLNESFSRQVSVSELEIYTDEQ